MTLPARRQTTRFDLEETSDPPRLARALTDFAQDIAARLDSVQGLVRVAVLDVFYVETGASVAVNTGPFPKTVQTPFSVLGAWVVSCEEVALGEAGIPTSAVGVIGRPVSGDTEGQAYAYEVQFLTGLSANRKYQIRLAVAGVRNG